jgi:hypothetical protein
MPKEGSFDLPGKRGGAKKEIFVPAEKMKLHEDRRAFIAKKLAQYEQRLNFSKKDIMFAAPELLEKFQPFYGATAKIAAAKMLLTGEEISKNDYEAAVRDSVQEVLKEIPKDHEELIEDAIYQGWLVLSAYNEDRPDALHGSQPVE